MRLEQFAGTSLYGHTLVHKEGVVTPEGVGVVATIISIIICTLMYKLSKYYTPLFFGSYKTLSEEDKRNWDTRYSSMFHSAIVVWYAYTEVVASDFFWKEDPVPNVLRTNSTTYGVLGVSVGYFVVDFLCCAKYNLGGFEMLAHHAGSLLSVVMASITGQCHMHALWMLVTEFTTPFINFRWWFDKGGLRHSNAYLYNGICILISWIPARILLFPPFFYTVWTHREEISIVYGWNKVILLVFPLVLFCLNLFWFYKIVKGAYKLLVANKKDCKVD